MDGQPQKLSSLEWFLLKAAAYLHDVGMQCTDRALLQREAGFPEHFEFPLTPPLLEKIRHAHNLLSYHLIMKAVTDEGSAKNPLLHRALIALSGEMIEAIALLCKGHKGPADDIKLDHLGDAIPGGPVNLRLLCTLLRFGDALDADSSRLGPGGMDIFMERSDLLPPERKIHIWKHYFVSNVVIRDGLVELHFKIPERYKGLADLFIKLAEEPLKHHSQALLELWQKERMHIQIVSIKPQTYLEICRYTISGDTLDYLKNWGKDRETKDRQVVKDAQALSEEEKKVHKYLEKVKMAFEIDGYSAVSNNDLNTALNHVEGVFPLPTSSPREKRRNGVFPLSLLLIQKGKEKRRIAVFPFILTRSHLDLIRIIIRETLRNEEKYPLTVIMEGVQEEGVWGYAGRFGITLTSYSSLIKGLLDFTGYVRGLIQDYTESDDNLNQMYVDQDAYLYGQDKSRAKKARELVLRPRSFATSSGSSSFHAA